MYKMKILFATTNPAKVIEYKKKWGNIMNNLINAYKLNNRHHVWSENHPCVLVI